MIFAGHDEFKLIQEIHMGLGGIPNQEEKGSNSEIWSKVEKRVQHARKAQILGLSSSKGVFGKGIPSRDRRKDIHKVKIHDI